MVEEMKYKMKHKRYGDGFPDEVFTVKEIADGDITFHGSPYKDFADEIEFIPAYDPLTDLTKKRVHNE